MSRSLLLDPRSERAANSPLEIFTEPAKGPGVYVTDHKYPDPEQEILSAGGREGKRRTGPPILGNRQIPLEVFVMGRREDYAWPLLNLCRNPGLELSTKLWGLALPSWAAGGALTRVQQPFEGSSGEWVGRVDAVKDATATLRAGSITTNTGAPGAASVIPGATYSVGILLDVIDAPVLGWDLRMDWYTAASAFIGATSITHYAPPAAAGPMLMRANAGVAPPLADFGQFVLEWKSNVSGDVVTFRFDGATFTRTPVAMEPWDGDSPGSKWTGVPFESASEQPGEGADHFEAIVGDLEGKLAKIRDGGGTYSRPFESGRLVFDVEGLTSGDSGGYEGKRWIQRGQKFATSLECLPHGRGLNETKTLRSQTTDPTLVFTESLIPGSVRALGELEIADTAAIARRGVVAALELPEYDYTQATAKLNYYANELTPLGSSVLEATVGRVSTNTIKTVLTEAWRPLASTKLVASSKHLTHVGVFRIFVRVRANAGSAPPVGSELQYRLEWGQGDLVERVTNDLARVVARSTADYYIVDLGLVRIRPAKVGIQRWEGQIIGRSYDPAEAGTFAPTSNLDDLRIVPASSAYLQVKAPRTKLTAPTSITNYDTFAQAEGVLNGKTAETGGVWATVNADGAGTVDFKVGEFAVQRAQRRNTTGLRIATLPTVIAGSVFHRAFLIPLFQQGVCRSGTVLRYVDANNYVAAVLEGTKASGIGAVSVSLFKQVAGVRTTIASVPLPANALFPVVSVFIGASGYCELYVDPYGAYNLPVGDPLLYAYDPALATGGVLASGKCGLYNYWGTTHANNIFEVEWTETWPPVESTLIASGRRLRWRHDGVQREDVAGGEQWSEVGYQGDPLLVPPSTKEARAMRAIVFPTRGDFGAIPDAGPSDDFTAQLAVTSRHVSVR